MANFSIPEFVSAERSLAVFLFALTVSAQTPDWAKVNEETLRHYQAVIHIDSTDPYSTK